MPKTFKLNSLIKHSRQLSDFLYGSSCKKQQQRMFVLNTSMQTQKNNFNGISISFYLGLLLIIN